MTARGIRLADMLAAGPAASEVPTPMQPSGGPYLLVDDEGHLLVDEAGHLWVTDETPRHRRFLRKPTLPKFPEWLKWASWLWNNQDTIMEAAKDVLEVFRGLFRRRAARAGV